MKNLKMEMKNELKRKFDDRCTGIQIDLLRDYDTGITIEDIMLEVADMEIPIGTYEKMTGVAELYMDGFIEEAEAFTETFEERGVAGIVDLAYYFKNTEVLSENLEIMIQYYILDEIVDRYEKTLANIEMTEDELWDVLEQTSNKINQDLKHFDMSIIEEIFDENIMMLL